MHFSECAMQNDSHRDFLTAQHGVIHPSHAIMLWAHVFSPTCTLSSTERFFYLFSILYDFSAHISSAWNACSSTNWAHLVTWAVPKLRCKGLQYREIQNNASLCNMDFVSSSIVCKSSDRCIPSGQSQFSIQAQFRDGLETLSFLRFVGSNIFTISSLFKI